LVRDVGKRAAQDGDRGLHIGREAFVIGQSLGRKLPGDTNLVTCRSHDGHLQDAGYG